MFIYTLHSFNKLYCYDQHAQHHCSEIIFFPVDGPSTFFVAACSRKRYGVPENTISVRSLYDDDLPPPPSLAPQSLNK
nr:unnamed protein product [Haemonchus contortus]